MRRGPAAGLALAAVAAAAAAALLLRPRGGAAGPDIVVLLWDTTRADRLGAYGYGRDTTPWLSSVAAEGVLYEQCRTPSPWTVPAHASLFTGLLPRRHGALSVESPLAPAQQTLAERLRDAGYDTVLLSNNALVAPPTGLAQGFDTFVDVGRERGEAGAGPTLEVLRMELGKRRNDPARAGRPLFLFVNLMEPHLPYDPREATAAPWLPEGAAPETVSRLRRFEFPQEMAHDLGIRLLPPEEVAILSALYDGEVRDLDRGSAALEGFLREAGVLGPEGGLLVVTADHGENLGEHGLLDHKLSVAEPLLHVPLVIRWPGRLEGGRRVGEQVRLQDLFPTLLEAAGVPGAPPGPAAASLLGGAPGARPLIAEFPAPLSFIPGMREIYPGEPEETFAPFRRGLVATVAPEEGGRRLKWVRTWRVPPQGPREPVGESLFDLAADPGEERDLLAGSPAPADRDAAARLRALAEAALGDR